MSQQGAVSIRTTPPMGNKRGLSQERDLRFRMAYAKTELPLVIPYGITTIDEMISKGIFPDGVRPHPTAHKIWTRRVVEEWLENQGKKI